MKRRALVLALLLSLSGPLVFADTQNAVALSSQQLAVLRSNCLSVQSTLQRIHTNDALSRVYLGQEYEIISTKLMAPMNSRVALNKLDSVALTETTVDFNAELDIFRALYRDYDQNVARGLAINCRADPGGFYAILVQARTGRAKVRASVAKMQGFVTEYRSHIGQLQSQSVKQGSGGAS